MKKSTRWHLYCPVAALLFQVVPPLSLWAVATSAYGQPQRLPEGWQLPLTHLVLAISAVVCIVLGSVSVYGLLVRSHVWLAFLLIAVCCLPAFVAGSVYLYGLLVLCAVV